MLRRARFLDIAHTAVHLQCNPGEVVTHLRAPTLDHWR